MRYLGRGFVLVALAALVFGAQPTTALGSTSTLTNPKHFFWGKGQPNPQGIVVSQTNDLIWHGGNAGSGAIGVETKPAVYVTYWGPDWASGFTTTDANGAVYTSGQLQNYVNTFFGAVGGSRWNTTQTQYCKNVPVDTTNCALFHGVPHVGNPSNELHGVWVDPSPVPSDIIALGLQENLVDDPIASEARKATAHFGYDPNATYFVLTGPSAIATGQPVYCGYHTQTTSVDGLGNPYRFQYAFIPYLNANWPGLGTGVCGMNFVNATSDSFGRGVFDGYSIVDGHEYGEAETDPDNFFSVQDGWNDASTSENGDKCAWTGTANVSLNGVSFAMQPMWSNRAFDAGKPGCQMSL